MDTIEQLLQRGQQAQGSGFAQALISASEAERFIEQLSAFEIEEVGAPKWHTQHDWIERLNLQAHYNAQNHSDEFVVELLVSLDKLHVLVHDLLLIEAWKEFVYPLLSAHLAEHVDSVTTYLLLYHEVTVANLLQVALYHSHAAEALSEDYALELADWCYRKVIRLNAEGHKLAEHKDRTAEELMRMTRLDEQEEKRREVEFSVLMCSLAILRYVTDSLPRLPMGALSRVVCTNDTLMGLLPLLDQPPWVRTRPAPGGKGRPLMEKWAGNRWQLVVPADRLKITQTDGQVWLTVTNLLVEPRSRAKYDMDEFRRERILGLKRHLNEIMFDQLPVLKDLQRVLDELALGVLPDSGGVGKSAALILEAVPVVRAALLRGRNWRAVADRAQQEHFGKAAVRIGQERIEAMMKHLDFMCELEPELPGGGKGADGLPSQATSTPEPPPPVKMSTWRKVHDSGVFEPWYDLSMEVDDSRPPEPVEVSAANAGSVGEVGASGGGMKGASRRGDTCSVPTVHGLRYRLRPLDVDSTRPLPANGKAVVRWGSLGAEALLQLPGIPTRSSEEGAAVLWVTVGLLAVDGLVLQVKLKKAAKPKERDRVAGVWYAYHPVAGALTVLREHLAGAGTDGGINLAGDAKAQQPGKSERSAATTSALPSRPLVQVISEPAAAPVGKAVGKPVAAAATESYSVAGEEPRQERRDAGPHSSTSVAGDTDRAAGTVLAATSGTATVGATRSSMLSPSESLGSMNPRTAAESSSSALPAVQEQGRSQGPCAEAAFTEGGRKVDEGPATEEGRQVETMESTAAIGNVRITTNTPLPVKHATAAIMVTAVCEVDNRPGLDDPE